MKIPFDLSEAKQGAPVVTFSGKPARIIYFNASGKQPLVVLLKEDDRDSDNFGHEEVHQYAIDGSFTNKRSSLDLVML